MRDEVLVRNGQLSREAVEREGSDANVIVAAGAAAADEVIGQLTRVEAGLFIDSATGSALDLLVFDRYGLTRKAAAPALGTVVFNTTAPNPLTFTIPSGTVLSTADGIQFEVTAPATFPITATGPVTANVRSLLAGTSQQAKFATLTSIITPIPSSPADLTVFNDTATSGADDEESDDSLRNRARQFFPTARAATLRAIETAALGVLGVRSATAFETLDALGRPAGVVSLVIADAFSDQLAQLGNPPVTYQLQSTALAQTVFGALSDVRAAGIAVQVTVASVLLQPIQLALAFQSGADPEVLSLQAKAAIVDAINKLRPGQGISRVDLVNALRSITGLIITGGEIVTPAVDVTIGSLQVVRTLLALVSVISGSFNVPLVNRPVGFTTTFFNNPLFGPTGGGFGPIGGSGGGAV